jgi:hypothetical protein
MQHKYLMFQRPNAIHMFSAYPDTTSHPYITVNQISNYSRSSYVSPSIFNFHCAEFGASSCSDGICLLRMRNRVLSIYRF